MPDTVLNVSESSRQPWSILELPDYMSRPQEAFLEVGAWVGVFVLLLLSPVLFSLLYELVCRSPPPPALGCKQLPEDQDYSQV